MVIFDPSPEIKTLNKKKTIVFVNRQVCMAEAAAAQGAVKIHRFDLNDL